MDEKIWYQNISGFFSYSEFTNFFPTKNQSKTLQLNSFFRFSVYLAVLLYLYNQNDKVFLIPILVGAYTFYDYQTMIRSAKKNKETFFSNNQKSLSRDDIKTRHPTYDNPFMNPNLLTETNPNREAQDIFKKETQDSIDHFFRQHSNNVDKHYTPKYKESAHSNESMGSRWLTSPDDTFQKNNGAQRFYTVPSTTIPNDQDDFAHFLYGKMNSRKSVREY